MVKSQKYKTKFLFQNKTLILLILLLSIQANSQEISKDIPLLIDESAPVIDNRIHGSWYLMTTSSLFWLGASYFQNQLKYNRERAKEVHSDYLKAQRGFEEYKEVYYTYDNRRKGAEFGRNLTMGLAIVSTVLFSIAITF